MNLHNKIVNFFPLYNRDKRLPILARIIGYTLADGICKNGKNNKYPHLGIDFETNYDARYSKKIFRI